MFKQRWLIGAIAFNAMAIIALAVYLFFNFSSINLFKGIVLIVLAGIVMISVVALMIYLTKNLKTKNNSDKNTPQ
jgi:uncharacterized membrane protein